jgi:hypothetical protein
MNAFHLSIFFLSLDIKNLVTPGAMAQDCNLLRGRDWEDHGSRSAWAKSLRPHLNQWLGVVGQACHASYSGKHK